MKFTIKHEITGRIRIHLQQERLTYREADLLQYYLEDRECVRRAKTYERTADVAVDYLGSREQILAVLKNFQFSQADVPEIILENSGRALNAAYREKLIGRIVLRAGCKWLLPYPIRCIYTVFRSIRYILRGFQCLSVRHKLEVPVLDAIAIGVSVMRGSMGTAASIMFFLGIGELLEEWTHKKSVGDLARCMSLNISKVWLLRDGKETLVPTAEIKRGDQVTVHMGNVIPFDGIVTGGEAMVNQASLTGESLPVKKESDRYVYAGTVIEEGELNIQVKEVSGSTRFEKIVTMIEETEKLKSKLESRAEHLADRLVPYTLLGTALTGLLTRNITKTLSVLMVDFSCALKLAMPISVLSAIREAGRHHITVKGGKYLEAISEAATIVFDKTGTLTEAKPKVKAVIPFGSGTADEMLRLAACLEEHFPHSMAKAVVQAAKEKGLEHEEMHSKVDYIVAHGISSHLQEKKVVIGSYHFVFEDEHCRIDPAQQEQFDGLTPEYSYLYLAVDKELSAVICIEDPLREEASAVVNSLRMAGIKKVVMMTGDSEKTAAAIAAKVGVDEYYSEVLPEDKAHFIEREKSDGRTVIMVGDGINDSPALSASDVGIAISEGAEIAREIADITIAADDLYSLVTLKFLSEALMKRIRKNYKLIVGINSALIVLGVGGIIQPTTSALLHNTATLGISLKSMGNLLV